MEAIKQAILEGNTVLGIELGSTRIKSVLIDEHNTPIAIGVFDWENSFIDGSWTYSLDEIWQGIQGCYKSLLDDIEAKYGVIATTYKSIGISGMMHGYLAFNKDGDILVPFRTWRNNYTEKASNVLSQLFNYPIPQRWSISHLYQAILKKEVHIDKIDYITTISSYIHWKLTNERVIGINEASGMFQIDINIKNYNEKMINLFNQHVADYKLPWKLEDILPKVMVAGEMAGVLTDTGATLLDSTGRLKGGIKLCPPEGDAGTGMVATNSVAIRTGNVSAGTSVFAMIVLEKELSNVYPEIDLVTTPSGELVAMVHSNNCTSNVDGWINIFDETLKAFGIEVNKETLYKTLYNKALEGDADGGGLLMYGYISGEHITHFEEGRPLFVRSSESKFNLANFIRVNLLSSLGALKMGLDLLLKEEAIEVDKIVGHGGFFKTDEVGQRIMSAVVGAPVSIMETAGEGGAWGIALLASYMSNRSSNESLTAYLNNNVFLHSIGTIMTPVLEDMVGFEIFIERYKKGLVIERAAVDYYK